MSIQTTNTVDVSADVSLRVPRGEAGNLESGVRDVLANADGVTDATVDGVTSVRPTWTDVRVDADVRLAVAVDADESDRSAAVSARLADGFGITGVNDLSVDGGD